MQLGDKKNEAGKNEKALIFSNGLSMRVVHGLSLLICKNHAKTENLEISNVNGIYWWMP
jgi:uncharacterized membrane protein YgdD (TMEM256/DUF423 family)